MSTIVFSVKSNRIHDIVLEPGVTVAQLQEHLAMSGYDVRDALVTVNRFAEDDKLIGHNGPYVLKEGDSVAFKTVDYDLPAVTAELADIMAEEEEEEEGGESSGAEPVCPCAVCASRGDCGARKDAKNEPVKKEQSKPESADTDKRFQAGDLNVSVSKDGNGGIVIHLSR